jgi:hypothetical protein
MLVGGGPFIGLCSGQRHSTLPPFRGQWSHPLASSSARTTLAGASIVSEVVHISQRAVTGGAGRFMTFV